MKLLYFLSTINLLLNKFNFAVLIPPDQFEVKFSDKFKSENSKNESNNLSFERRTDHEFCEDEENMHTFISHGNKSQIIWVTWNRTRAGERVVLPNICSAENGLPVWRRCSPLGETAEWERYNNQTVLIDCRISMFCEAEAFDHYVVLNNGEVKPYKNSWKQVEIGEYSCLRDICLQPNGLHLTRKCYYDVKQQRARWASVDHLKDIKCFQHTRQPTISNELNILHENITTSRFLLRDLSARHQTAAALLSLLKKPKIKLLPADVQLSSAILKTLVTDYQDIELSRDVLAIAHSIMCIEPVVLRMSAELNATNSLLETFENYLDSVAKKLVSKDSCRLETLPLEMPNKPINDGNDTTVKILNLKNIGVYAHIARNISVFYINPSCAHISGIAIYDSYRSQKSMTQQQQQQRKETQIRYDSLNDLHYRFIFMNESINDFLHETHLELATFIPIDIWNNIQHTLYKTSLDTSVVVFKIYAHDGLFIEKNLIRRRKPFSKILSISLPGYTDNLPGPLPFIFRHKRPTHNTKANTNTGCGYWNYSTWIGSGVFTNSSQFSTSRDLILCSTNHLTQFSYLLGGSYRQNDLSNEILVTGVHQRALDIISLIGCSLSLLGLLGIWTTALLFKSWRSEASNKVLLNMCVALTLQLILFLIVNTDDISKAIIKYHNYRKCIVLGAFLQYSTLVLFLWMLIVAVLQFQRYVTVIGIYRPKHYIIKSALVAWSLPLIPTLLVALLDSNSYIPTIYQLATDTGFCYPSGNGLHFGVLLPVSLVVLANFSIFLYVFYSISHTLSMSMQRHEKHMVVKQIRLSILLFFLLGLSWIFGIFAFMKAGIIFSYLFCLTATLQGFVLFIYFVIIDENARNSWQKMMCPGCARKSREKKATEMQSMTTASTSLTHDVAPTKNH